MNTEKILDKVLLLSGIAFLLWWWFDYRAKVEQKKANDIGSMDGMGGTIEEVIEKIPSLDISINQTKLKNFDPKPMAEAIYDSGSWYSTDEDQMYVALSAIPNKLVLQLVSIYFQKVYGESLSNFIIKNLDTEEAAIASNILKSLPNSFTN